MVMVFTFLCGASDVQLVPIGMSDLIKYKLYDHDGGH